MANEKKFLDYEGVEYLWSKINMQDYPNNETLINVINAIDETKADKSELIQNYNGELTSEEIFQAQWNLRLPNTIQHIYLGDCQQGTDWVHGFYCNYFSGIENFMTIPSPTFSSHPNVLTSFLADCYNLSGYISDQNYSLILPRIIKNFSVLKENGFSSYSSFSVYEINKYVSKHSITPCRNFAFISERDEAYYLWRIIPGESDIDGELAFDKNGKLLYNTMAKFDDTLSYYYKAPSAEAVGNALALKADVSKVVSVEPQELTDEQKAQARANIDKYVWHTFSDSWGTYTYAINPKYPIDYNIAQTVINTSNNGSISALEDIVSWLAVPFKYGDNSSLNIINNIINNYDALTSSDAFNDRMGLVFTRNNTHDSDIYYVFISNSSYLESTHYFVLTTPHVQTAIYYNKNTNMILSGSNSVAGVDDTLSEKGYSADAKVTGDALALKIDKSDIATDEEIIEMLMAEDMFPVVADTDGSLLADENGNILLW